jgi:hypothetical protein
MMAKKIKVEFEFSPEELRELITSSSKGQVTLSEQELEALSQAGTIRIADYLDADSEGSLIDSDRSIEKVRKDLAKSIEKLSYRGSGDMPKE